MGYIFLLLINLIMNVFLYTVITFVLNADILYTSSSLYSSTVDATYSRA
jgi:hypothetical protein